MSRNYRYGATTHNVNERLNFCDGNDLRLMASNKSIACTRANTDTIRNAFDSFYANIQTTIVSHATVRVLPGRVVRVGRRLHK